MRKTQADCTGETKEYTIQTNRKPQNQAAGRRVRSSDLLRGFFAVLMRQNGPGFPFYFLFLKKK
jgi:hemin uptake protein HemP